ncbi:MAG: GGDEF domain-containing protein [Candidatus Dormibacteria bacterium]
MRQLPLAGRIYVGSVLGVASVLGIVGAVVSPARFSNAPIALVLMICATVAQQFKVKSPKHQSYYTTTIFFVAAALLLRPAYVIVIVIAVHAIETLRVRYPWYIQAFNVANFLLCSIVAGTIFSFGAGDRTFLGPTAVAYALCAGAAFVLLNHLLTALVIMWARGVRLTRSGTLDWDNLGTDFALMSVGVLGALLWLTNPWLVPLCLCPLFLIYRSLMVPNLREEARTDPKTSLANMKHWNEVARVEIDRARRFQRPLSVLLADLDLLRDVNNRYGHLLGDQMIRRASDAIRQAVREYDLPARFGGDEFTVLMPEATLAEAKAVAERIRRAVAAIDLKTPEGTQVNATVSIGVALFPAHGRTPSDMLAAADRAVYQAKALGRNRVCAFGSSQIENARPLIAGKRPA